MLLLLLSLVPDPRKNTAASTAPIHVFEPANIPWVVRIVGVSRANPRLGDGGEGRGEVCGTRQLVLRMERRGGERHVDPLTSLGDKGKGRGEACGTRQLVLGMEGRGGKRYLANYELTS